MTPSQCRAVFARAVPERPKRIAKPPIEPRKLLREVTRFRRDSFAGRTGQKDDAAAVRCVLVLYELLGAIELADDQIVFAHNQEAG